MPRISQAFGLSNLHAQLDFVDVELERDTPLFLCPYAIQMKQDEWSLNCIGQIRSFFGELLEALRAGNIPRATHLLAHLHEPNETRLGVSKGQPRGRAFGAKKAKALAEAMMRSRAFSTGILSDISDAEMFVKYIGRDTISDLVTNVTRHLLADYTVTQCNLHGIQTQESSGLGPIWNSAIGDWESRTLDLYQRQQFLTLWGFPNRF